MTKSVLNQSSAQAMGSKVQDSGISYQDCYRGQDVHNCKPQTALNQAQIASTGVGRERLLLTGRAVDAGLSVSALTSLLSLVEGHGVAKLTEMGEGYNLRSMRPCLSCLK